MSRKDQHNRNPDRRYLQASRYPAPVMKVSPLGETYMGLEAN